MEDNRCFEQDCILSAEYACPCSFPPVYICKLHVLSHMETPNKDHALKPIFIEPYEETKEAILLPKCDSSIIEEFNNKFKEEKKILRNFREEKSEILASSKSSDLERKLKSTCLACKSNSNTPKASIMLAYQTIVSAYHPKPSLFHIAVRNNQTNLLIYNTEIESQASIILDTPEKLDLGTCITQLPNGKLFCFGRHHPYSGVTLSIDEHYRVEELPLGTACCGSSAIYFNNNIYCFGGFYDGGYITLSSRFDLDRNQWNELTPLPKADVDCDSIIFNENILISGWKNKNLLRYSIDSNSFSTIPYDFIDYKKKLLLKAERLYLIECQNGSIYESEIESDTAWRKIANNSIINFEPSQTYYQYNKEGIYIGCIGSYEKFCCFKFNLNEKRLINIF